MNTRTIINKIKAHLDIKNDGQFAEFLGIKPNSLATWIGRNTLDPYLILSKCEEIDANWLITGQGEMLRAQTESPTSKEVGDMMPVLMELLKDGKEDRQLIREGQATTNRLAQAAIDTAESVKRIEAKLDTRLSILEERIADESTISRALQEVLVVHVGERLPNSSPQEIGAVVGNAVTRISAEEKKKKRGTRTAANT